MKTRSLAFLGATALILGSTAPADAFSIFTDRTAWEAAIAGATITNDPFSNDIPAALSITLDSGVVSTNSTGTGISLGDNSVDGGFYNNATDGNGDFASPQVLWQFPQPVIAFGADFVNVNAGQLNITGNFDGTGDQTLTVSDVLGGSSGFLGIVGMANFSSFTFGNNTNSFDFFQLDNASFAVQSQATPEPATVLGLLALSGLGAVSRWKGLRK